MQISYKRDMAHNYMVPEEQDVLQPQDYQIHMLMENEVAGLLPCEIKRINGESRYFYDITSKQSMKSVYDKSYLNVEELHILMKGLYKALMEVKRFLLDVDKVVLEAEVIYMDIETKEPLFMYLPSYPGNILESFQQFASALLQMLDQNDREAVLLGYEVYRKSMEDNYSLEQLLKEVSYGRREKRNTAGIEKQTDDPYTVKNAEKNMKKNVDKTVVRNAAEVSVREKQEEMQAEKQVEKQIERQKERQTEKGRSQKKESRKKRGVHPGKKQIAVALFSVAAVVAIGTLAWIFHLNITQVGGLSFLLVSLLAWWISTDGKKKKEQSEQLRKKEQRADRRGMRKMKREEKSDGIKEPKEKLQKEKLQKEKLQQEKLQQEKWQIEKLQMLNARGKKQYAENTYKEQIYGEKTYVENENVGATVLLCEGEEYVPHLTLISMNPRERNSIVLLNDMYTIGKLKNRVDICIEHPSISRIHARICKEGTEYFLYDMNSTNGTFVNGRRLAVNERVQIQLSDEIRFAEFGYYVGKC